MNKNNQVQLIPIIFSLLFSKKTSSNLGIGNSERLLIFIFFWFFKLVAYYQD